MKKRDKNWGGNWTIQKLDAFEAYVKAYLTIMLSTREKCKGWPKQIIYFDGFAGSGKKEEPNNEINCQQNLLENLEIKSEEENLYQGSCERVLQLEKKFDKYIFVDINTQSINELKNHLQNKNIDLSNCNFIAKDVNDVISKFVKSCTRNDVALILLDPFGMQVEWKSIEKLKDKRIDLWILVPSGVIINRLLDKKGKLKHIKKLEEYLGMSEEEIKNSFYEKEKLSTLFGDEEYVKKLPDAISKIAKLYVSQLKKVFEYVTDPALELKNSRKVTIFHFIFASNNKSAKKIASQIIEKKLK